MHFCPNIPIILVGCKKDLRMDQKVIEDLRRKDARPVSPAVVSIAFSFVFTSTFLAFLLFSSC
jgi:GTPase SAR1 family protein